ncbi:glucose dehydrogenase [FAD, quinone]-like, partial [Stegodyphus dumicola]|uniref:glucose dehydrogenase [FAD, quinone]-like n=1 Tax=Stegodyphus dumicola TaxID=202533 RepID=UPI0015B2116B
VLIRKRRARGVQFDFRGTTYEVKAKREVILSAGTTNTAQLLMLSGIGPRKELDRFKIPVKADLPVGKNLQDHIGVDVNFLLNSAIPEIRAKLLNPVNIHKYIQNRTGPLASLEFCSANAFLKKHAINPREDFPNHEVNFLEGTTLNAFLQFGLRLEVYEQVYGPYRGKPFITCVPHLLQPRSRGTVTLQSDNPYDPPMIDPNYLEDPRDVKDIVEGMKVCRRISLSAPLKRLGSVPFATLYPGCEQYAGNEDDYFRCQLRSVVLTFSHYVGTAKMGDPEDPTTVVDPQLRVKYIKGLRVVDASVMPTITSGNTNVPTMMIAEKASDMIKSTINCYAHNPDKWTWTRHTDFSNSEEVDPTISENPVNALPQDANQKVIRDHPPDTLEEAWDKNSQIILPWNKEITDNKMFL